MKQENNLQTYTQALIFRSKASLLRVKRGLLNLSDRKIRRFPFAENIAAEPIIAESKTRLWTESAAEERFLLAGKVHNLRIAVKKLHGLEIPANEIFSFWRHVGRANKSKGYAAGRELREGCLIPSIGGGLCQISNALYDAALQANFEIVERHAHSQIVPGSLAEQGRDATVFWNYIDLRFKSPTAFRIETILDKDFLTVRFRSENKISNSPKNVRSEIQKPKTKDQPPNSCATCGVDDCFRNLKPLTDLDFGRRAFLVDEFAPEFDEYLQATRIAKDVLFIPIDGARFRKANYAWTKKGFSETRQSWLVTFERSYKSRKLAAQGASRQLNLLAMYRKLAESYAKSLEYDCTHLIVQQNLLPFLWQTGALGGRTFDVLMSALPMESLQKTLDFAASFHPNSPTLGDFRADEKLVAAESEALKNAGKIITPHTAVAALFPKRAKILDWKMPLAREMPEKSKNDKLTVVFPASTVGRKGCYELRAAIRGLEVKIIGLGAQLEGADFWSEFDYEKGGDDWLAKADLVVLPAFIEHKPRRLLQAVANKLPVIASKNCGLENIASVRSVEAGNVEILRSVIEDFLANGALSGAKVKRQSAPARV